MSRRAVAVCLHAFYADVFKEFLPYLANIAVPFDLYITCPAELMEEVEQVLSAEAIPAEILVVQNVGMDVIPFIAAAKKFKFIKYDVVLKVHTKNNKTVLGRAHGELFRRMLLGSSALTRSILNAFAADPDLLMVGPDDLYRSTQYMMYNNRKLLKSLCGLAGIEGGVVDWGFFAGTMFWIRGESLSPLVGIFNKLQSIASAQKISGREKTGRDGSVAHALERIWGALMRDKRRKVGLTYARDASLSSYSMRIACDDEIMGEPIRRIGASEILTRWSRLREQLGPIKRSNAVDGEFYRAHVPDCESRDMDPALHYILYGELWNYDPSRNFSTSYYKLRRPDVVRAGVNVLLHYITHGSREGMLGRPEFKDWFNVARMLSLFDDAWYRERYGDIELAGLTTSQHYQIVRHALHPATSANFDPKAIPLLSAYPASADDPDLLAVFLEKLYLAEALDYDELLRVLQNNDFEIVPELAGNMIARYGITAATLCALALSYIYLNEWKQVNALLYKYWCELQSKKLPIRHHRSVIPISRYGNDIFEEVAVKDKNGADGKISVCIYTALFGDIDDLPPVLAVSKYCRFVCFTERPRNVEGWEFHIAKPLIGDPNLDAKIFKVFPGEFLQSFDYTMFVDANTLLIGRIDELLGKFLLGNDFVMFRHPERSDVYAEAVAIVESKRHSPPKIMRQIQAYKELGLPPDSGLLEASFIWRIAGTGNRLLVDLMRQWWAHILSFSKRDQLSLACLIWKTNFRPKVLPRALGSSRENDYFLKLPHAKLPEAVSVDVGLPDRRTSLRAADMWFLYAKKFANTGSTVLRGDQLHQLLKESRLEDREIFYSSFDDLSDKILFLTKGYLAECGSAHIRELKKRGNIILADFVDAKPNPEMISEIDVLIASSIKAFIDYSRRFPGTRVHHVTHHVDLRIPQITPPEGFSAGYFGELVNTITNNEIAALVDFVGVDTSRVDIDWIGRLKDYSFHYATRQQRSIDAHKPFLKGFVAAQCGANMMIQANAGDAIYYLGRDYPFLLSDDPSSEELIEKLQAANESFGGSEWRRALDIMAEVRERSSRVRVATELSSLLKTL